MGENHRAIWRRSLQTGITVQRTIVDNEIVADLQDKLHTEFGSALSFNADQVDHNTVESHLVLLGKQQTSEPVTTAMATTNFDRAQIFSTVAQQIPRVVWRPRTTYADRFTALKHPRRTPTGPAGIVSVALGIDPRHRQDRQAIQTVFESVAGQSFNWGHFYPAMGIARLVDPSVAKDITRFRLKHKVAIPLGGLTLLRKTHNSVQRYER